MHSHLTVKGVNMAMERAIVQAVDGKLSVTWGQLKLEEEGIQDSVFNTYLKIYLRRVIRNPIHSYCNCVKMLSPELSNHLNMILDIGYLGIYCPIACYLHTPLNRCSRITEPIGSSSLCTLLISI